MKNQVQDGDVITVTAPYAVTSGQGVKVGAALFGIASGDAANGATLELQMEGVFDVTALSTDVVAVGDVLYWDDTNRRLTTTSSSHMTAGVAVAAKASGVAVARIMLHGAAH